MRRIFNQSSHRGQTILEYMMVLMVVVFPIGMAIREVIVDKDDKEKKNILMLITRDSYGENGRLGVIGRPYP